MRAVTAFAVHTNSFEGVLPEGGLQAIRTMSAMFVHANRFAGTLPNRAVPGLGYFSVSNNDIEGKMSQTSCRRNSSN
eukprot:6478178-Amphidinium_carterae.1